MSKTMKNIFPKTLLSVLAAGILSGCGGASDAELADETEDAYSVRCARSRPGGGRDAETGHLHDQLTRSQCELTKTEAKVYGFDASGWHLLDQQSELAVWYPHNELTGSCGLPTLTFHSDPTPYTKIRVMAKSSTLFLFGAAKKPIIAIIAEPLGAAGL